MDNRGVVIVEQMVGMWNAKIRVTGYWFTENYRLRG